MYLDPNRRKDWIRNMEQRPRHELYNLILDLAYLIYYSSSSESFIRTKCYQINLVDAKHSPINVFFYCFFLIIDNTVFMH